MLLDVPYSAKRVAEGFLLVLGVIVIGSSKILQKKWVYVVGSFGGEKKFYAKALMGIVIIGIISALLAVYKQHAFLLLTHYFLLFNLVVLCVIAYLYKPVWFEYGLLIVLGIMAGLYLTNVIISYTYSFFIPDFPVWPSTDFVRIKFDGIGYMYPEPFSNFINFRFFNHIQTWSLPLLTLLVLRLPKKYWAFSKIAFIIACGWWVLVYASDARGTMVATFTSLIFIFIMYRKKARNWLKTHSLAAGIGLAVYLLAFKLFEKGGGTILTRFNNNGRFEQWEYAMDLILQNPFLGVGPMNYSIFNTEIFRAHPHNFYLQFSSEWGLIAGILLIAIIVTACFEWYIRTNEIIETESENSSAVNTRVALTASLMAALIHGLVSGISHTPLSQIMMVLVLAWMIGLSMRDKKAKEGQLHQGFDRQEKPVRPWLRYSLLGVSVLAAGFLIWSYTVQIPQLNESRWQYIDKRGGKKLYPRYWDQGIIGLEGKETGNGGSEERINEQ